MSNKPWDEGMKRMASLNPDALLQWLLPGAVFLSMLPLELDLTEFDVDLLLKIVWKNKEILLHVEFQTRNDYNMADRTVRYNVLAHCEYELPVLSIVIYLFPDGNIPTSPLVWDDVPIGFDILKFNFLNFKVKDMTVSEVLALDNIGLLPLVPLTKDGAERGPVQHMLEQLRAFGDEELLFLGYNFANLVFQRLKPEHLVWLKGKYREMQELFEQSGLVQQLREEGQIKEARDSLLKVIDAKYPHSDLLELARGFADHTASHDVLQGLMIQISVSSTIEGARATLLAWAKNNGIQLS
jgi:hypothetical protein